MSVSVKIDSIGEDEGVPILRCLVWDGDDRLLSDAYFWTVTAIAARAGVGVHRVRQLIAEGRFPSAVKVLGQWFVPQPEVGAYLAYPDRRRSGVPRQGELTGVGSESA